jgi:hypothetical protein
MHSGDRFRILPPRADGKSQSIPTLNIGHHYYARSPGEDGENREEIRKRKTILVRELRIAIILTISAI